MEVAKTSRQFVNVVFPGSAVAELTYSCPPALDLERLVGRRVVAMLRKRKAVGIATRKVPSPPRGKPPQPILEVLDSAEVVSPDLMSVAGWLQDRYCCSLPQALRCVSPPIPRARRDEIVKLLTASTGEVAVLLEREHPLEAEILRYLAHTHRAPTRLLPGRDDPEARDRAVARLRKEGHVALESEERVSIPKARVEHWASVERSDPVGRAARRVVAFIQSQRGTCSVDAIKDELRVPASQIRRLTASGVISLHPPPHAPRCDVPQLPGDLATVRERAATAGDHSPLLIRRSPGFSLLPLWLDLISEVLERGRSALLLYPEVTQAQAAADQLERCLPGDVVLLHGRMPPGRRNSSWSKVCTHQPSVVVGTRSAAFAPLVDAGLVIVEEEHDKAYKSEEVPRYHAREVVLERARRWGARTILSSLSPSLESYGHVLDRGWHYLDMGGSNGPEAELVDLTDPQEATSWWHFSATLTAALQHSFSRDLGAVLLHNRRGFASFLLCQDCGTIPRCGRCEVPLVFHKRLKQLRCHHCNQAIAVPDICSNCRGINLKPRGTGTERIERALHVLLPEASVACVDAAGPLPDVEQSHVVVGTQAILRRSPWEGIALVAVLEAELGLGFPDFRASEHTYQFITAVRDWTARCTDNPRFVVQSRCTDNAAVRCACTGEYDDFASQELALRREVGYPPYRSLVRVEVGSQSQSDASRTARRAARMLSKAGDVVGPSAAPLPRLRGRYRYQLLVKGEPGENLAGDVCQRLRRLSLRRGVRLTVDPDPVSMM